MQVDGMAALGAPKCARDGANGGVAQKRPIPVRHSRLFFVGSDTSAGRAQPFCPMVFEMVGSAALAYGQAHKNQD
jgi:hypothetical protein